MYRVSALEPAGIRRARLVGALRRALELWRRVASVDALSFSLKDPVDSARQLCDLDGGRLDQSRLEYRLNLGQLL
jgi:hypothetical protein